MAFHLHFWASAKGSGVHATMLAVGMAADQTQNSANETTTKDKDDEEQSETVLLWRARAGEHTSRG